MKVYEIKNMPVVWSGFSKYDNKNCKNKKAAHKEKNDLKLM